MGSLPGSFTQFAEGLQKDEMLVSHSDTQLLINTLFPVSLHQFTIISFQIMTSGGTWEVGKDPLMKP